jgi:Tfp pilus assembly protein PilF
MANSLLTGKPATAKSTLQISQIQLRLKHWKEAEDALAKAEPFATKDEDKANLYFQKASLAEREKHYDQAEQFFHKVLEIDPNNAITLNNLGYMLVDKTTPLRGRAQVHPQSRRTRADQRRLSRLARLGLLQARQVRVLPKTTCARPSSAPRPTPPSTTISAISTRRPAASASPPPSGRFPL